ncbi:MAG: phage minor head protein [Paludibacter sp.]|nr:phage minor head protein [Paludibacter sp.]
MAEASLPPEFIKLLSPETLELIEAAFNKNQYSGVLSIIGKLLTNQVHDNYKTITADWKTPDIEMLHRLTRDVWSFSAAKDYNQMRDLTLALRDDTGKLREFGAFKEAAQKICTKYNETWLQTEYNQAVAASQNAARWTQFTADKADIPFLEYQTVGDDAVRASHALLDGIVRKVDDSFWSTHYPPNGWGCRCEVIQAVGAKTPKKDIPNVGIPEMFRTNLAQTGLIYPKNHPYYFNIPKAEIRKAIAYLPPENTFVSYSIAKDTVIDIHPLHGDKEVSKNVTACKVLKKLDNKAEIKLMPVIEANAKTKTKDVAARKAFYGDKYIKSRPETCPDLLFNGKIAEIETAANTGSSIKNRVRDGKLQADFVLIHVPDEMNLDDAYRHANGQMNWYKDKEDLTVWVFNNSGKRELTTKKKR